MSERTWTESGGSVAAKMGSLPGRLARNRAGTVSMLFGLLVIPLTAVVGLAVDFGRVYAVKSHTQAALDAAALAAGRVAQLPGSTTEKTSAAATAYFNQAKPTGVVTSTLQFSPNAQLTEFKVTATSWIRTPFLGVLHALNNTGTVAGAPPDCVGNHFGCVKVTTTATAALCPSSACISNAGGSNVEVSLMLDVTLSMCDPCSKIDALKKAAKDLIDIVVWDDQSEYTSRIALAPFAESVNVGTTLAPLVRGTVTTNSQSSPQNLTCSNMSDASVQPTSTWIKFPKPTSSCSGSSSTNTWKLSSKCVTERIGTEKYTDAAPGNNAWLGKGYFGTNADTSCPMGNYTDAEVNSVYPLTSDRTVLKRRIDKLSTTGSTAGHLGTAWAYYLLSPNWNTVFQQVFPETSPAAPYADLAVTNSKGMPKLRKIAVLMTDGEYNTNYCKGVEAKDSFSPASPDINCNSENAKSLDQAKSLCTAIKNKSIEVYTVGFQVNADSKTFLKNCATDAAHYYDATSEFELQAAFRDIALKIASLRLTN
jgi:Flp pilus assembly protein TadG